MDQAQKVDYDALQKIGRDLLVAIGENPDRPGLVDTPRRFAGAWREFIEYDPGNIGTSFDRVQADQMVVVSGMRLYSLCEHHLLPFWCDVSIGYLTDRKVLGLSKFARIAQLFAHRLQVQERLVTQIAETVQELAETSHVAVYASGQHLCMMMRGIKVPGVMTSSFLAGRFRESESARLEFMSIVNSTGK